MNNYTVPGEGLPAGYTTPSQPYTSQYQSVPSKNEDLEAEKSALRKTLDEWKKKIKLLRMASRATSAVLNVLMFAFMAFVISTFLVTRDDAALGRNIWPQSPKTWPTYMLLAASLVTFVLSVFVLCFYAFCFRRASESWKLVVLTYVIHIGVWVVVATLYRTEKVTNDLWGWSCTDIATELQMKGGSKVDFQKLCKIQSASSIISYIETGLKVAYGIVYFIFYRKVRDVSAKRNLAGTVGEGALGLLNAL
ncbi:hypothetical protein LSUE1_G009997 [Lachnellula suecica]|uniref:MARVEL domain-containing protein n=1 Tax=Lachnellula suecica TaxID=602035 RepID=A0A8T9BUM6_9HELO|nr:hypothetical protein LSUE1_G009997 [Lachnellula suecica]